MPTRDNTSTDIDQVDIIGENMEQTAINDSSNGSSNGLSTGKKRAHLARKQSSPMMPPFMVSAPGKVIVFGEHAVVHGKVGAIAITVPC